MAWIDSMVGACAAQPGGRPYKIYTPGSRSLSFSLPHPPPLLSFLLAPPPPHLSLLAMVAAKIAIVYHSFWGHVATLAEEAALGAKAAGVQADIYTFPETLSDEVLGKLHAVKELGSKHPHISADALSKYDGVCTSPAALLLWARARCASARPKAD